MSGSVLRALSGLIRWILTAPWEMSPIVITPHLQKAKLRHRMKWVAQVPASERRRPSESPSHIPGRELKLGWALIWGKVLRRLQKQTWKVVTSIFVGMWREIYQYSWNPWPASHFCRFLQEQAGTGEACGLSSLHDSHQAAGKRNVLRGGEKLRNKRNICICSL